MLTIKFEGNNTSGSHKLNSAIAQAYYTKQQGLKGVTTETGDFEGDGIIILSGLKPGDQVIVNGQQKVSEGMRVDTGKGMDR